MSYPLKPLAPQNNGFEKQPPRGPRSDFQHRQNFHSPQIANPPLAPRGPRNANWRGPKMQANRSGHYHPHQPPPSHPRQQQIHRLRQPSPEHAHPHVPNWSDNGISANLPDNISITPLIIPAAPQKETDPEITQSLTPAASNLPFQPEELVARLVALRPYEAPLDEVPQCVQQGKEPNNANQPSVPCTSTNNQLFAPIPKRNIPCMPILASAGATHGGMPRGLATRHANLHKTVEFQKPRQGTVLTVSRAGEKRAAELFMREYHMWLDCHEIVMWINVREITGQMFHWLGYCARPQLIEQGRVVHCPYQPYITKYDFLTFLNCNDSKQKLKSYIRLSVPLLTSKLAQKPRNDVSPSTSIPHLLRLLDMSLEPDTIDFTVQELTIRNTVNTLMFVENMSLQALCSRGVWGTIISQVDLMKKTFVVTIRGWLGLFPAQDIPQGLLDDNNEGGLSLQGRIKWLRERPTAKHQPLQQTVHDWESTTMRQKMSEYLIWGKEHGLVVDLKQLQETAEAFTEKVQETREGFTGRLQETREDFTEKLQETTKQLQEITKDFTGKLQETTKKLQETREDFTEELQETTRHLQEITEGVTKKLQETREELSQLLAYLKSTGLLKGYKDFKSQNP